MSTSAPFHSTNERQPLLTNGGRPNGADGIPYPDTAQPKGARSGWSITEIGLSLLVDSVPGELHPPLCDREIVLTNENSNIVILSYILQNSIQTVSILVVGRLGPEELSVAAFSLMFAMVTGECLSLSS